MSRSALRAFSALVVVIVLALLVARRGSSSPVAVPDPDVDDGSQANPAVAVLAGGCFWGVEGVYEHVKGVLDVVSGYAGGSPEHADYRKVSTGMTDHAESVRITFDPARISYGELLKLFFAVAHDPTQLNRQGPDIGPQYRSAIFYSNTDQERIARAYIEQLTRERVFSRAIVTEVVPLEKFYPAEDYHQDYMKHHPNQPYIVMHDRPKVKRLEEQFPELYRDW